VSNPGSYVVTVSDASGCIISIESFAVSFGLLATPIAAAPDPVCVGEDVILTASGSTYEYRWFDAATGGNQLGVGATLVVNNILQDLLVYVEAFHVSIDGCVSERQPVLIEVIDEIIQAATLDTLICFGNAVALPWGEVVTPEVNTSYSFTWQSAQTGCDSLILTVNVALEDKPSLSLPAEHTLFLGDSILLIPQLDFQPDSIAWSPTEGLSCTDCLQPWAQPIHNTDYELTLWTPEGCVITAIVHIEVDNDIRVYFPNVFSPNGDAINDKFTVSGLRDLVWVKTLVIYDRWGGALWQGTEFPADGTNGWDGYTTRGQIAPTGVYVWTCEIELIDGTREVYSGDVTLVK
jgi:gliding motility-associated-like protein